MDKNESKDPVAKVKGSNAKYTELGEKNMRILLFGVSNVGKTTVGKLLSEKLKIPFYDLDEAVKADQGTTLEEFVHTGTLQERDKIRLELLEEMLGMEEDEVIAVTPLSYPGDLLDLLDEPDIIAIELRDTPENIFDRIVFSDENDVVYKDDEYAQKHKEYYLREIREDLRWYGSVNQFIFNKFDMAGMDAETVANRMIEKYGLDK